MATIIRDDLWRHPGFPGMIAVTTNSVVNSRGILVMGRGSAFEAADRITGIQAEITREIYRQRPGIKLNGEADYGFLIIRSPFRPDHVGFGIFQAKRHWRDVSTWETIKLALDQLNAWATEHPEVNIRCPLPGAGCGQIGHGTPVAGDQILDACSRLPASVTFCWR